MINIDLNVLEARRLIKKDKGWGEDFLLRDLSFVTRYSWIILVYLFYMIYYFCIRLIVCSYFFHIRLFVCSYSFSILFIFVYSFVLSFYSFFQIQIVFFIVGAYSFFLSYSLISFLHPMRPFFNNYLFLLSSCWFLLLFPFIYTFVTRRSRFSLPCISLRANFSFVLPCNYMKYDRWGFRCRRQVVKREVRFRKLNWYET